MLTDLDIFVILMTFAVAFLGFILYMLNEKIDKVRKGINLDILSELPKIPDLLPPENDLDKPLTYKKWGQ